MRPCETGVRGCWIAADRVPDLFYPAGAPPARAALRVASHKFVARRRWDRLQIAGRRPLIGTDAPWIVGLLCLGGVAAAMVLFVVLIVVSESGGKLRTPAPETKRSPAQPVAFPSATGALAVPPRDSVGRSPPIAGTRKIGWRKLRSEAPRCVVRIETRFNERR